METSERPREFALRGRGKSRRFGSLPEVSEEVAKKVAHIPRKSGGFQPPWHTIARASPKGEVYARVPSFSLLSKIAYGAVRLRRYRHKQRPPCQPSTSSHSARRNIRGTAQRMNRSASESSHRIKRISNAAIITTGNRYIISRSWNIVRGIMMLWLSDNVIIT